MFIKFRNKKTGKCMQLNPERDSHLIADLRSSGEWQELVTTHADIRNE